MVNNSDDSEKDTFIPAKKPFWLAVILINPVGRRLLTVVLLGLVVAVFSPLVFGESPSRICNAHTDSSGKAMTLSILGRPRQRN